MGDWIVFWVTAPVSVLSAVAMVLARNAVHAALFLIVNFFTLAVFFLVLGSPFLFVVQIIVYAGAIMVLFLFVIMLLGVATQVPLTERIRGQRWLAALLGAALVAEVAAAVGLGVGFARGQLPPLPDEGSVRALARLLFSAYFFPFEVTSVLLIVAAVGAMLHGRARVPEEEARLEEAGLEPAGPGGPSPREEEPRGAEPLPERVEGRP
ncbi:MAG TPA: NADH-quinone oxidoreductase subunit J [Actinomycetota bacterium]|nr:NADH-quinone oxidoreductase subunit J [Actinomycetota bacterium]